MLLPNAMWQRKRFLHKVSSLWHASQCLFSLTNSPFYHEVMHLLGRKIISLLEIWKDRHFPLLNHSSMVCKKKKRCNTENSCLWRVWLNYYNLHGSLSFMWDPGTAWVAASTLLVHRSPCPHRECYHSIFTQQEWQELILWILFVSF